MHQETRRKLILFLGLTAVSSAIFHVLIARTGTMQAAGGWYVAGLMWAPGLSAILTRLLLQWNLRGMGWRWGKTRYQVLSMALPFLLAAATYGIVVLAGLAGFPDPSFVEQLQSRVDLNVPPWQAIVIYTGVSASLGLAGSSLTALGEEIGWRGLLVPELAQATGFTGTALVSGFIWAVWHYPAMVFADYRGEAPLWFGLICFTVMAIGLSFVMAWIRLRSGSVWTAMFLHAAHNVVIQTILNPLMVDTGPTEYVIGEFGAGMAIAYAIVGFVFWLMRHRLAENGTSREATAAATYQGKRGSL